MSEYFKNKILDRLLPGIYSRVDESGEFESFIGILSSLPDEIKNDIDLFEDNVFDIDRCRPEFLPYLLYLLGYDYDYTMTTEQHRKAGKLHIPYLEHRGTVYSYKAAFKKRGHIVDIEQARLECIRWGLFNWNKAVWPGEKWNKGSFIVKSNRIIRDAREILEDVWPSGKSFFFQFTTGYGVETEQESGGNALLSSPYECNRTGAVRWGKSRWGNGYWTGRQAVAGGSYTQKMFDGSSTRHSGGTAFRVLKEDTRSTIAKWGNFKWGAAAWPRIELSDNKISVGYQTGRYHNRDKRPHNWQWGNFRWGAVKTPYLPESLISCENYTGIPEKVSGESVNGYSFYKISV